MNFQREQRNHMESATWVGEVSIFLKQPECVFYRHCPGKENWYNLTPFESYDVFVVFNLWRQQIKTGKYSLFSRPEIKMEIQYSLYFKLFLFVLEEYNNLGHFIYGTFWMASSLWGTKTCYLTMLYKFLGWSIILKKCVFLAFLSHWGQCQGGYFFPLCNYG